MLITAEHILSILLALISTLFSIIIYQARKRQDASEQRIKDLEASSRQMVSDLQKEATDMRRDMNAIRFNYVDRFDKLHQTNADNTMKIIEEVNKVKLYNANIFVKREDCVHCNS